MKIFILLAGLLALSSGRIHATVISVSDGLFSQYTVSASDVVGSGYIRFYGPTNDDYDSVFTGWVIIGTNGGDPTSQNNYPAYDSVEALDMGGKAGASGAETAAFVVADDDSYTLLLGYAIDPICIGDKHSHICGDPGVDIPVTVSTSPPNKSDSTRP